jgi:transcriptional regulator with XRE-family HTH domain
MVGPEVMKSNQHDPLTDPEIRRTFEEELLVGEATDTLVAMLESAGLTRKELASRLGVSSARVSQILSGAENLTLRSVAAVAWALGIRFELQPTAVSDRRGTPAEDDPPAPPWLDRVGRGPSLAALTTAADTTSGRLRIDWTRLRGFADWAASHPRELRAALAAPPARTGTVLDAILASFAEQLALDHGMAVPRWTRSVAALASEWSAPATPRMRSEAKASTPEAFRRRNIVLSRSALFRSAAEPAMAGMR